MQTLTLIVPFEVLQGQEEAMKQQWNEAAEPLSHVPGFLSARLYEADDTVEEQLRRELGFDWLKARQAGRPRFRFVNIARWASLAHYEAAIGASFLQKANSFRSYLAFYRASSLISKAAEPTRQERPRSGQEFTLIVPFEVPAGQEEEMHRQFTEVVKDMGPAEGSLGPGLYEIDTEAEAHLRDFISNRAMQGPEQFRFVNVAQWTSLPHYEAAIGSRSQTKPISFPSYPAYYRVSSEYTGGNVGEE